MKRNKIAPVQKRNFGVGKNLEFDQNALWLVKTTLTKVSYYLERVLVKQFNKKNRRSGKPWRKLRGFQLRAFRFE